MRLRPLRRDARAGGDDAGEVERVGRGHGVERAGGRRAPHLAQHRHGVGQRVLLARHAGDEAAAANLAARFETAVDARELAPRRRGGLAGQQPPEHDPVAPQQAPRLALDGVLTVQAGLKTRLYALR